MSERRESPPGSVVRAKLNAEGRNDIRCRGINVSETLAWWWWWSVVTGGGDGEGLDNGVGVVCLCLFMSDGSELDWRCKQKSKLGTAISALMI